MKEIVIIITDITTTKELCSVDETLMSFGLSDYNNGTNICGLRNFKSSLCLKDVSGNPKKDFDLLILPDVTFDADFADIIKYFTEGVKTVYILFHKNIRNPNLPVEQTDFMQQVIVGSQINKLYQSHGPGSIYCDDLKEIAEAISTTNESEYNSQLNKLKRKFPDEVLERKLNLLHDCLTPEGAAEADTSFLTAEQKKLVEFLAKHKDNLAKDYIAKLTELRISLLGS